MKKKKKADNEWKVATLFVTLILACVIMFGCSKQVAPTPKPTPVAKAMDGDLSVAPQYPKDFKGPSQFLKEDKPAKPKELPAAYVVEAGDSLWKIAGKWGDPYLWTLWWKANRDYLTDPDLIYTGDPLLEPDFSDLTQIKRARERAFLEMPYKKDAKFNRRQPGF